MNPGEILSRLSTNRLGGEPVPGDLATFLAHPEELAERTEFRIEADDEGWAPWLDTSYLTDADRADPDIVANVRAIEEVCGLIAFISEDDEGQYLGYWRGPARRPLTGSPVVFLDNERQFRLLGASFAEAVLSLQHGERFDEARNWMRSLGLAVPDTPADLAATADRPSPGDLHRDLYARYCG